MSVDPSSKALQDMATASEPIMKAFEDLLVRDVPAVCHSRSIPNNTLLDAALSGPAQRSAEYSPDCRSFSAKH